MNSRVDYFVGGRVVLQQRWYQPRAGDVQMRWATASALYNPRERQGLAPRRATGRARVLPLSGSHT